MKNKFLQPLYTLIESWKAWAASWSGSEGEVPLLERSNMAEWLESRLHLSLTQIADDMFGSGTVTRDERKVLSGAIGAALDVYHQYMVDNAPQLFERRPWEDAPESNSSTVSESDSDGGIELAESGDGMFIPLMEKAVRRDGTIAIKIIQPGWGSSGYYPAEVLERDGPKIFKKGTKMYWNHQTPTEEAERPEGDLNNLSAELATDAKWQANGPAGAGLYADAKVFEAYKAPVDDLGPHIGTSIRAFGKAKHGEIEGREGLIITELTKGKSIDFVTAPGAGGQILSLFEAARTVRVDKKTTTVSVEQKPIKEARMDEQQEKQLLENVTTLQSSLETVTNTNARLTEALVLRDAKDMVKEALTNLSLPEVTKARLIADLPLIAPVKEGALDKDAFGTKITEAIKAEAKYLTEAAGLGSIRGLGGSDEEEGEVEEASISESLQSSFTDLGLSENGAKIAARGH
jgi:hypothetical protein